MPERVQFSPLEAKVFEGKAPPTSWFNENIVRYYQIKSDHELLREVVAFTKQLQSEKIAKSLPAPVEKEGAFVQLPENATPEEIHNAALFNALQPNLKTEIEFLEKMIPEVQKGNPHVVKELNEFLAQLKVLARDFPNLNQGQLNFLSLVASNVNRYAQRLPFLAQRRYFVKEFSMMFKLLQNLEEFIKDTHDELQKLGKKTDMLEKLQKAVQTLSQLLANAQGRGNLTPEDLSQILSNLQLFAESFQTLGPKEQKTLGSYLKALEKLKGLNKTALPQVLSDALLKKWIQEFLKQNPNGSVSDLKEFLLKFLEESNLTKTSLAFINTMGSHIKKTVKEKNFPFVEGAGGHVIAKKENGKIIPHEDLEKNLAASFAPDDRSVNAVEDAKRQVDEAADDALTRAHNEQKGLGDALKSASQAHTALGKGSIQSAAGSFGNSIPDEFRQAVLDHFIPMQEEYLMELSMLLSFDNYGAEMGNDLLDKVMDFQDASTNYSFFTDLHVDGSGNANQYTGNYAQINAELAAEMQHLMGDMAKAEDALRTIQQKIKDINNSNMTPDQKQNLLDKLGKYASNLLASLRQMSQLNSFLHTIHVQKPPPPDPTKYPNSTIVYTTDPTDTSWLQNLSASENLVVNGDPAIPGGGGGLVNIQNMIQTDQQNFSDQGQNQQMKLSMHMTEFQQEMTVASTGLQLMNQMYMTIAQAIYK